RICPSFRSIQMVSSWFLALSKPVKKMREPQMQGEELPGGSSVLHSTCSVFPKATGYFNPSTPTALPPGPRNCGHTAFSRGSAAKTGKAPGKKVSRRRPSNRRVITSLKYSDQHAILECGDSSPL